MRSPPPAAVGPGRPKRWWLDRSVRTKGMSLALQQVLADAVNAETGARGYATALDPLLLAPCNLITIFGLALGVLAGRIVAAAANVDRPGEGQPLEPVRDGGVIAYLTKPLDLTELGQLLDSFAAGHNHEASPALGTGAAP